MRLFYIDLQLENTKRISTTHNHKFATTLISRMSTADKPGLQQSFSERTKGVGDTNTQFLPRRRQSLNQWSSKLHAPPCFLLRRNLSAHPQRSTEADVDWSLEASLPEAFSREWKPVNLADHKERETRHLQNESPRESDTFPIALSCK